MKSKYKYPLPFYYFYKKVLQIVFFSVSFIFLTAFGVSTLDYTHKIETLADMPKGNPDPGVGIVVHPHSTGMDVLADSSQNVRFTVSMSPSEDDVIILLRSSSRFDYTSKKISFIDDKHGFSSNNIYEFSMGFDWKNYQWEYIKFMPFPSVIEWVTKEKLIEYLTTWATIFEKAGWERKDDANSNIHNNIKNFIIPTPEDKYFRYRCCVWETSEYEAAIWLSLRDKDFYKSYVPKKERKKITTIPDGYIAFIDIIKKSQYPDSFDIKKQKEAKQ